jgi:DNA modification methylase
MGGLEMALIPVNCTTETYGIGHDGHVFLPGLAGQPVAGFSGTVQLAIVDRPTAAKSSFQWKSGADDWLTARSSVRLTVNHNRSDGLEEYLLRVEQDLLRVKELLGSTGAVYVFSDQLASAHVRLLLDDIFGRSNFLNEIIWAREAGLKPAGRFTRSHETIFLYRKGRSAIFNAGAAGRERGRLKSHMRRSEEGGRAYYTRESGGRVYRYFEDDVVSVGDVWSDIPEITAKDDERTGWEGQRPEALLSRMIAASSTPGGIVCDMCSGPGTVASAAQKLGRRTLLYGSSPIEQLLARRRLLLADAKGFEFTALGNTAEKPPSAAASIVGNVIQLNAYSLMDELPGQRSTLLDDGLGSLEYWAAGRLLDSTFHANAWAMRTRQNPTLPQALPIGEGAGEPCIQLVDACGEQWLFVIDSLLRNK